MTQWQPYDMIIDGLKSGPCPFTANVIFPDNTETRSFSLPDLQCGNNADNGTIADPFPQFPDGLVR
jgi:hypothetical protein